MDIAIGKILLRKYTHMWAYSHNARVGHSCTYSCAGTHVLVCTHANTAIIALKCPKNSHDILCC